MGLLFSNAGVVACLSISGGENASRRNCDLQLRSGYDIAIRSRAGGRGTARRRIFSGFIFYWRGLRKYEQAAFEMDWTSRKDTLFLPQPRQETTIHVCSPQETLDILSRAGDS